jgi:hypothetical protein
MHVTYARDYARDVCTALQKFLPALLDDNICLLLLDVYCPFCKEYSKIVGLFKKYNIRFFYVSNKSHFFVI